jgi:hypothetical protein
MERYLFVRGFATISLVGGLGVEDRQNGLWQAQILRNMIYFCAGGGGGIVHNQNQIMAHLSNYHSLKKDCQISKPKVADRTARVE